MAELKRFASTAFGEIAYSEAGSGPHPGPAPDAHYDAQVGQARPATALFVHGIFHNGHLWRHVIPGLSDIRRCIAVDLMAHGDTKIAGDPDLSFNGQADMLEAFCTALKLDQVDVVANDSATGIVTIFAARHPERIRSLVLTNGDVHDNWPPAAFERTRKAAAQGSLVPALRQMLVDADFARTSFAVGYQFPERIAHEDLRASLAPLLATEQRTRDFLRFMQSMDSSQTIVIEPQLKKLQAPTLVVWGTADEFFDVKWAYWLKDTIPGCRKVVELDGAKLFFPEERPHELVDAIRDHWHAMAAEPKTARIA
jgi:pimeloyl-ACP methyl ester carboxylesterase